MKIKLTTTLILLLFTFTASGTLLPPPLEFKVATTDQDKSSITKEQFINTLTKVEKIYKKIVNKRLGILTVQKSWSIDIVNAAASRVGPLYTVTVYGGLARHPEMTVDGLTLVVCHEFGHHFGGAPRQKVIVNKWSSVEGEADYFSTFQCLRRVWKDDDNIEIISSLEIDSEASHQCEVTYKSEKKIAICKRAAMAGLSVGKLFASFKNESISYSTPDDEIVSETYLSHPKAQCRLDTYLQGALCDLPLIETLHRNNPERDSCTSKKGSRSGIRPRCWYKP